jgi:hypothetical protein
VQKIEKIVDLRQFLTKQAFKPGDLKLKVQLLRPALRRIMNCTTMQIIIIRHFLLELQLVSFMQFR